MNAVVAPSALLACSLPTSRRVHDALYDQPMTKPELRKALSLPRMAADRAIFELQARGLVEQYRLVRRGANGRRIPKWRLTREGRAMVERRMRLDP